MTKPSSFILSSDYTTLKNESNGSVAVTVTGAVVITGSGTLDYSADLPIGSQGSLTRGRISSTANSSLWYAANHVSFDRVGTNLGSPASYEMSAFFWRPNATTLRCQIHIQNPYSSALTTAATETVTFYANTFVPPFS